MLFTQKKKQLILLILNIFLRQANIINSKRFIYCSVRNWEINDSNFFDFFYGMQRSWYAKVLVCKGPPLHQAALVFIESLYEACTDEDICTP